MLRLTLILPLLVAMLVRTAAAQTQVAAVPFIQWQKFVDPNEGSFWMEVPSGSLAKRAEASYAEYRRQKASGLGGRGFRLPL